HADDSTLSAWLRDDLAHTEAINPQAMVESIGNIPGDFINLGFLMLKPFELGLQKYLNLLGVHVEADTLANFLRLEKWIFDNPDQAGAAWREYVEDFYMHNKLIKGEIDVYGEMVDLANITLPVLNIVAEHDHLVPPASSLALRDYVGTSDYTEATFPVGHVGIYVSSRVQAKLPKLIDEWLARH
ncbi:MAG: alpha/beta fold hydrolase, partial [Chloroflexota bacterium]